MKSADCSAACGLGRITQLLPQIHARGCLGVWVGSNSRQKKRDTGEMMAQNLLLIAVQGLTLSPTPSVRVWDNIFSPAELDKLVVSGTQRAHSFTSVWDREGAAPRTVIEAALHSVLAEVEDENRYVEYWYRGVWKDMESHRDIDEALARSRKHAGTDYGIQRCPEFGHVLYLDVAPTVRGPTCVWEEAAPATDGERAGVDGADVRAGAPRPVHALHVVPACPGRLLRFRGDLLHAVPKPTLSWVTGESPPKVSPKELRAVLLFNTWSEPPTLPPPNDPPPAGAIEALRALSSPPVCLPCAEWGEAEVAEVAQAVGGGGGKLCTLEAPLLGDARRRGCDAPTIRATASEEAVVTALRSSRVVHQIAVESVETVGGAVPAAGEGGGSSAVEVDGDEELAVRLGYAEHLEDEFFGASDDDDDDDDDDEIFGSIVEGQRDDDDDDDDEQGDMSDFWANVAALNALEEQSNN